MNWTPDENTAGLLAGTADPLRYDGHDDDPREVAGMFRAAMPEGVRVLDVGCGAGGLTALVNAGKKNHVLGLEPDAQRAAVARSRGIAVITGVLDEDFVRTNGRFDVIVFADVLEHLPSPANILRLAWKALDDHGQLLISVPNVAHWSVRANLLVGRFDYEDCGIMDSTHLRWFTVKSLRALLERSGFQVRSFSHSAGTTLPVYQRTVFRWIPSTVRSPLVRSATRLFPRIFGCQHVVVAEKLSELA